MRDLFPILSKCTYLASHSLGAVPAAAREALSEYWQAWAEQGILAWDGPWWQSLPDFTGALERILGAPAESVIPVQNATLGMAAVASCLNYSGPRNRIVFADLEFTTCFPFWSGQQELGAEVVLVRSPDGVNVPLEAYEDVMDERTLLVVTSHAFFRSGALQDIAGLAALCKRWGAYLLVDGYQSLGAVPLDFSLPDFVVGGCHKWLCGGPGAGFLQVRPELIEQLQPRLTGWFGLANPFIYEHPEKAEPHPGRWRFLTGTANVPAFYAAREGLRVVEEVGVKAIRQRSLEMTAAIMAEADARGLKVKTPRDEGRNGMVCLDFPGADQVRHQLEQRGVIVDWRPDCGLRVSPHFYNDRSDLERFWACTDEARKGN